MVQGWFRGWFSDSSQVFAGRFQSDQRCVEMLCDRIEVLQKSKHASACQHETLTAMLTRGVVPESQHHIDDESRGQRDSERSWCRNVRKQKEAIEDA